MAKSLIVRNVEEELVRRLKMRAARHNRSAEAEHREIFRTALAGEPSEALAEVAGRMRALTRGRKHTPAEQLQRESRDER
jgi:plasmid stability protein